MRTTCAGSAVTGRIPLPNYPLLRSASTQLGPARLYDRTDDSDQMILIMETILELNGSLDERRYAAKLLVRHGTARQRVR